MEVQFFMPTYSEDIKKEVIRLLSEGFGYVIISQKLNIPKYTVKRWINAYRDNHSLSKSLFKKEYSATFKREVIEYRWANKLSFRETANTFGISNIALIAAWQKRYLEEGFPGLIPKPKGKPSMNKKEKKETVIPTSEQQLTDQQKIRALEAEVARLRLELSFWDDFKNEVRGIQKDSKIIKKKQKSSQSES